MSEVEVVSYRDLLTQAAAGVMVRIRDDQARVPDRIRPMLVYIEDHLFEPTMNVNRMKQALGLKDNSIAIHFHAAVGQAPHGYITSCRLETAQVLIAKSDIPMWKVADILGYSSIQVFSRTFHRFTKTRPTEFRRDARRRRLGSEEEALPNVAVRDGRDAAFWRRAMQGLLSDKEAGWLIRRLVEIYLPERCRDDENTE